MGFDILDADQLPPELDTVEPSAGDEAGSTIPTGEIELGQGGLPKIPGYQSIRQLGRGGMGVVILADDLTLERRVAIKLVSQSLSGSKSLRDRFDSEVKTLASLHHQNIAQLYSASEHDDVPYFVMEFVDGKTLDDLAREPMKSQASAELMLTLSEAIEHCHSQGVLHRDLKPSNILMTGDGIPKIADFGLAKVLGSDTSSTRTGEILGTPGFMSPEQAGGIVKNLGPACDVYGLGAILYRLLTGRPPFVAAEPFQAVLMVLSEDPVRPRKLVPNIAADLETICLKCLEKKPSNRYSTAQELHEDLRRFLSGEPIVAKPAGPIARTVKWAKRNLAATVGIVAATILLIGGISGLLVHNATLADELDRSKRLADHGSEFAKWITEDHLTSLNRIAGTTASRTQLVKMVRQFLEESYDDMPADPVYTKRLGYTYAQLAANLGGIRQNTTGDLELAESSYLRAIELYDNALLSIGDPEEVVKMKLDAMIELSDIRLKMGQPESQLETLASARSIMETLADSPRLKYLKIQVDGRIIDRAMAQNRHEEALVMLNKLGDQISDLEKSGEFEPEMRNQQISLASRKGLCEDHRGNPQAAEPHLASAVKLCRESVQRDPENVTEYVRLAQAITQNADILFSMQDYQRARPLYEEAVDLSRRMVEEDQDSVDAKIELGVKLSHAASCYQNMNLLDDAETAIQQAIEIHEKLREKNSKDVAVFEGLVIYTQSRATICFLKQNFEDSKKYFEQHSQLCKEKLDEDSSSVFALNQIAENHLTQSLMVLSNWMNSEIDPKTVEQAPERKQIESHLAESLSYYQRIQTIMPLNSKQESQVEQLDRIRQVTNETVEQIKATANSSPEDKTESTDF